MTQTLKDPLADYPMVPVGAREAVAKCLFAYCEPPSNLRRPMDWGMDHAERRGDAVMAALSNAGFVIVSKAEQHALIEFSMACKYDATMEGPVFTGYSQAGLNRARKFMEDAGK